MFDSNVNICGTVNILKSCVDYGVKKIIYPSSAAVYGQPGYLPIDEKHRVKPISSYGLSKYTPEEYIRSFSELYNLDYTIFRYANVYGIRQDPKGEGGVVSIFMDRLFKNYPLCIFGDGKALRDYIYVEDVVNANIAALYNGSRNLFNIGTGVYITVKDLAQMMIDTMKVQSHIEYQEARKGDIEKSYFNIEKAKVELKWEPKYSLQKGLIKTINYYKNNI